MPSVPVYNTTSDVIPGFALMKRTGVNADGQITVAKPDADGLVCMVNGPLAIGPSSVGQGSWDVQAIIAYDPQDGAPAAGETWGAGTGSWIARKDKSGFLIDGGAGFGLVNAVRQIGGSSSAAASIWKASAVRVCITSNVALNAIYAGTSHDGVTLTGTDRVALVGQTDKKENGLYVAPGSSGTASRASDAASGSDLLGSVFLVTSGDTNAGSVWKNTNTSAIVVGTNDITFRSIDPDCVIELTSTYDATDKGYSWKLKTKGASGWTDAVPSVTGTHTAKSLCGQTDLTSGRIVQAFWLPGKGGNYNDLYFGWVSPLTTKGDLIVNDGAKDVRLGVGADAYSLVADSGEASGMKWSPATAIVSAAGSPVWIKYTVPYTTVNAAPYDFAVGAYRVDLFNLAAKSMIHGFAIAKTTVKFDDAAHNSWQLSGVGVAGFSTRYGGSYTGLLTGTVSGTNFAPTAANANTLRAGPEDCGAATTISAWFYNPIATQLLTQGSVEICLLISTPPLT